jgi:F-type H+-transporting ATPase subunit gamma
MPSLRTYRDRIKSVKSTRKITTAMKLVAASKLKKAQLQAEASQPYAMAMAETLARVAKNVTVTPASSKLLTGTGSDQRHLIIVMAGERGLCGGFNANLVKEARRMVAELMNAGKDVKIVCAGAKARDSLQRDLRSMISHSFTGLVGKGGVSYAEAGKIRDYILDHFGADGFDVCWVVYNEFKSILTQKPKRMQLIPFKLPEAPQANDNKKEEDREKNEEGAPPSSPYDFEPNEQEILNALLPKNLGIQIFRALLDSAAGEQAARMTAMDNATRNAGEKIKDLTLQYNRARQAYITKELIEIISGAEAV